MNQVLIPDLVQRHVSKLSAIQLAIWCYAYAAWRDGRPCLVSNAQWAAWMNVTERAVSRAHSKLAAIGAIHTRMQGGRERHVYAIEPKYWKKP